MIDLFKLKINLNDSTYHHSPISEDWIKWGGRAYTSRTLYERGVYACEPFDSKSLLVIATGLLAGSGASSTYRISIGGKSPLTCGIKEANSGGTAGYALISLGIRGIVIEGISPEWIYLVISDNEVSFHSADQLIGLDIFKTVETLLLRHGKKSAVMAIGPAGEKLYKTACIGITDTEGIPARHAARGGLGAVMGSKRLKAIVVIPSQTNKIQPTKQEDLRAANKRFAAALLNHPTTGKALPKYGTAIIVDSMQALGGLPTRNYSYGTFEDADRINSEALYNLIIQRGGKPTHACMPGCVIRCSNIIPSKNGEELNRALEYETIVLLGSNCGINDLETICKLNRLCDMVGVDTIEIGAAIGVAMEGGLLQFGDCEKALEILEEVRKGSRIGKMIAGGADETGKALKVSHVPTVKGQSMAAYDPRTIKGTGVTYATSPMGADHTAGNVLPGTKFPNGFTPQCFNKEHQIELSRYIQLFATMFDFLGMCWFAKPPIFDDFSLVIDLLNSLYDELWTYEDIFTISKQVIDMEISFNRLAGLTAENNVPSFFRNEPLLPNGYTFDVESDKLQDIHQINEFCTDSDK